jgi:DNA-binding NarL/FixJ family response regulator
LERKKVLVLQHQAANRGLLVAYVQNLGLPAVGAQDLALAKKILAQGNIGVVILDLLAGEASEIREFIKKLTSDEGQIQLIVLTHAPEPLLIGLQNTDFPRSVTYIWAQAADALVKLARALSDKYPLIPKAYFRDHLNAQHALKSLSNSQRDLLIGIARGYSNNHIAKNRGTTVRAVENLLKRTLEVMQLKSDAEGHSRVLAMRKYLITIGEIPEAK